MPPSRGIGVGAPGCSSNRSIAKRRTPCAQPPCSHTPQRKGCCLEGRVRPRTALLILQRNGRRYRLSAEGYLGLLHAGPVAVAPVDVFTGKFGPPCSRSGRTSPAHPGPAGACSRSASGAVWPTRLALLFAPSAPLRVWWPMAAPMLAWQLFPWRRTGVVFREVSFLSRAM